VGAWSLESAVAVAGDGRDEFDVLDVLTRLVDRSLVVVVPVVAGESRYRYLETVRHFALERLAEIGVEASLRDRHLAYFLKVAEDSQTPIMGGEQKRWLERLDVEHSDLLSAHAWCGVDDARAGQGLRLVGALWRYWAVRGHYALGGRILHEALARPGAARRDAVRISALVGAAGYALTQSDYEGARPFAEEALAIARELGDRRDEARCVTALATIAAHSNALDEARALLAESLTIYRELGRPAGIGRALHTMGYVAVRQGDLDEAHARYEEALAVLAKIGDDFAVANTLTDLAWVAIRRGEWEAARVRLATALSIIKGLAARREGAYALGIVAEMAASRNEPAIATLVLGAAVALHDKVGSRPSATDLAEQAALLDLLREELGAETCE
jgi:predicted ATPase